MVKTYRMEFTKKQREYMIQTLLCNLETEKPKELTRQERWEFKKKLEHWKENKRGRIFQIRNKNGSFK